MPDFRCGLFHTHERAKIKDDNTSLKIFSKFSPHILRALLVVNNYTQKRHSHNRLHLGDDIGIPQAFKWHETRLDMSTLTLSEFEKSVTHSGKNESNFFIQFVLRMAEKATETDSGRLT